VSVNEDIAPELKLVATCEESAEGGQELAHQAIAHQQQ
jgi:hypothetical protein